MLQLNKNSYSVYIIHMIVMGLIALILVSIPLPAMVKLLVLTILTFAVSNILVYAYNHLFKSTIGLRIMKVASIAVVLFAIVYFGSSAKRITDNEPAKVSQTNQSQPVVGLHMAVIQGNLEAIRQHIQVGSDLDQSEPSGGSSPLITAAVFGKTEAALVLIEAGADVNFKNYEGSTPLHTAAFFCRMEIVETLITNGADATIKNNAGSTALGSVTVPFEAVEGIYDFFGSTLGPLGLELDYEQIKKTRPKIAEMLREN